MIRFLFVYIIHTHLFKRRDIYSKKKTIASFQSHVDGQFWSSRSFLPWNARSVFLSKVITCSHITPAYCSVNTHINIHLHQNRTAYYQAKQCHNPEDHDIILRLPEDLSFNFTANLTMSNLYIFSSILE